MTVTLPRWFPLIAATLVVAFSAGWIAGGASGHGWWTEVTAAWVQAIGSVAAIVVAIWLPTHQHGVALRHKREVALSLALKAHGEICGTWLAAADYQGAREGWRATRLSEARGLLAAFPVLELESVPAVLTIREIRMSLDGASAAWDDAEEEHFPPQRGVQIFNIAVHVQGLLQRLVIELQLPRSRLPPEAWASLTQEQVAALAREAAQWGRRA